MLKNHQKSPKNHQFKLEVLFAFFALNYLQIIVCENFANKNYLRINVPSVISTLHCWRKSKSKLPTVCFQNSEPIFGGHFTRSRCLVCMNEHLEFWFGTILNFRAFWQGQRMFATLCSLFLCRIGHGFYYCNCHTWNSRHFFDCKGNQQAWKNIIILMCAGTFFRKFWQIKCFYLVLKRKPQY